MTSGAGPSRLQLWIAVVGAFVVAMAVMIAAAYGWVFVYSVVINPSGDAAFYEAYARVASPVVAVALSFPVFYGVGRFMRRFGRQAVVAALSVVAINVALDVVALLTVAEDLGYNVLMSGLAALGKIFGAYRGARHGIDRGAEALHSDPP